MFTATVVDDIQFLALDEAKETTELVTSASRMLISGLRKNGLEIDLTDKKLQVLCSDDATALGVKAAIVAPFLQKRRAQKNVLPANAPDRRGSPPSACERLSAESQSQSSTQLRRRL